MKYKSAFHSLIGSLVLLLGIFSASPAHAITIQTVQFTTGSGGCPASTFSAGRRQQLLPLWVLFFFSLPFLLKVTRGDRYFFARRREAAGFLAASVVFWASAVR